MVSAFSLSRFASFRIPKPWQTGASRVSLKNKIFIRLLVNARQWAAGVCLPLFLTRHLRRRAGAVLLFVYRVLTFRFDEVVQGFRQTPRLVLFDDVGILVFTFVPVLGPGRFPALASFAR